MKKILFLCILFVIDIPSSLTVNLDVGSSYNQKIMHQQIVQYSGIPFKKQVKDIFYTSPAQQIITGVIARDLFRSDAKVSITAGGIGETFVTIKLKSERGDGLYYLVEIYGNE